MLRTSLYLSLLGLGFDIAVMDGYTLNGHFDMSKRSRQRRYAVSSELMQNGASSAHDCGNSEDGSLQQKATRKRTYLSCERSTEVHH
jgi:hypothetical protein